MRKTPLIVSAVLVAAAALLPVTQGIAADLSSPVAPPPTTPGELPITAFSDIVADSAHQHLFISSGSGSTTLLVTDNDGNQVTTIPMAGAAGMTMAKGWLLVAESDGNDIAVVDPSSLTVVTRVATGANTCPQDVTVAADRYVVFGYTCDHQWGGVGVIDDQSPSSPPKLITPYSLPTFSYFATDPLVRAIPGTTRVVVGGRNSEPAGFGILDVAGTPSVVKSVLELSNTCENLGDLAVSPDGKTFIPACGFPYEHDVFSTTDLSQVGSFASHYYGDAAAFSSHGKFFAAGTTYSGLYVYSVTAGGHSAAHAFGPQDSVAPGGLAFSADEKTLFAVGEAYGWELPYRLQVISTQSTTPKMVLHSVPSAGVGTDVQVVGELTFADGSQQNVTPLTVTRIVNGVTTTLPSVTTNLTENQFSFTDNPTTAGRTTYSVHYAGDAIDKSKTASIVVNVTKVQPVMSVTSNVINGIANVTATLVGGSTNRAVTITATPSKGTPVVIASGPVDSLGQLTATYSQHATTKFTASYTGDDQYLADSVHFTASAKSSLPPLSPDPARTATIAVENLTPYAASLQFTNSTGFDETFAVKSHGADKPFAYTTCDPEAACNDGIGLFVSGGYGTGDGSAFFAAGHSYLVQVTYQPTLYPEPNGPHLTFHIIDVS
jgi:hypothetical protein